MTDEDRETFGAELSTRVRLAGSRLSQLKNSLQKMSNTGRDFMSHCNAVLKILNSEMKDVQKVIEKLLQERKKQLEKRRTKSRIRLKKNEDKIRALNLDRDNRSAADIPDAERDYLARENNALTQMFEEAEDQTKQIERQTNDIIGMQAEFVQYAQEQHATTQIIEENLVQAVENQQEGNKYLRYVEESQVSSRFAILSVIGILTFSLLFLDYWNP